MITFSEFITEKRGLWDNIHAKQERIKHGSKEHMRKPGSKGAPTKQDFVNSKSVKESSIDEGNTDDKMWDVDYDYGPHKSNTIRVKAKSQSHAWEVAREVAKKEHGHNRISSVGATLVKESFNSQIEEVAAWQRKEGKNPEGGLNKAGVDSYRKEHPGSHLQTAVTTKPSKLKKGSKAANRRKSFCARMSGMKKRLTSSETANDPNSRINKSLRKWNC